MEPVIDANVVIHGRNRQDFRKVYTVPEVFEEMKSGMAKRRVDNLEIQAEEPSQESLKKVREKSYEINSPTSETDEKLVALAETLGRTLVSDDKAVQNLAKHLDIDFEGYMEDEIEKTLEWEFVCENCGTEVSSPPCPSCGHRKVRRRSS